MENQNTQPEPSETSSCSKMEQSRRDRRKLANSNFLLNLIKHRPWLLWIGVGAFLFTTIYISLVSITQTSFVKEETKPISVTANRETTQKDSSLPLWLLGAGIVGGCAGAFAIALRHPSSSYRHWGRFGTTPKALSRRQKRMQAGHLPSFPPVASQEVAPSVPTVSVPLPENQLPSPEQIPLEETIVIVLDSHSLDLEESTEQLLPDEEIFTFTQERSPVLVQDTEENNPLATNTQSLVEMLDLRRKIPLSTILSESFQLGGKN